MYSNSPASQAEASAALRALFTAFPIDRGEMQGVAATYFMAVDGYSLKAIEGAVKRIIRGEASDIDKRFLPTPAQLGNLVAYLEKLYAPPERRLALPAPGDVRDDSPEGIAHRKAVVERCKAKMGPPPDRQPVSIIEDFDKWEAGWRETTQEDSKAGRLRLSEAAMEIMHRTPPMTEEAMKMLAERQGKKVPAAKNPGAVFRSTMNGEEAA